LFQPEKFDDFEQTFRATIDRRLAALRAHQEKSGQRVARLRLEPEIKVVMLEMLVNNFFGADVSYEELRERFVPAMEVVIDHIVHDTVRLSWLSGAGAKLKQARADFEELTDIALKPRKAGRGLWKQFKSDATDDALRSNIRVFLAGALEATTSFASWAIYHLARHPECQDQIVEEVREMDHYDPENLAQAVALRRVLEETLRLTPSLYFLPRRATEDTWVDLPDKRRMFIPSGTHVVLDVWHANRCEEFWGTDVSGYPAADFAPRRWDVLAKKGRSASEIMHFGFGHGARVCPGKFLGLLEVGLVVGAIVKVFRLSAVVPGIDGKAGVSTKPADGVLVDLALRE
jgi:cytochrome P450